LTRTDFKWRYESDGYDAETEMKLRQSFAIFASPCLAEARPPLGSAIMRDQMSKLGAAFLGLSLVAATPLPVPPPAVAAEAVHHIAQSGGAWGCRDKHDVFDILFLGLSTSFDTKLATALADGRCVFFRSGESVTILEGTGSHGLVKVQRGAEPATYWTPVRNVE
jgi:hypothetical protein